METLAEWETQLPISRPAAAAITLMQAGVTDLSVIAAAVGLPLAEVERIDAAEDPTIRKLAVQGIPDDLVFRLRKAVVCPTCGRRIFLVPCVSCKIARLREAERRHAVARDRKPAHHSA